MFPLLPISLNYVLSYAETQTLSIGDDFCSFLIFIEFLCLFVSQNTPFILPLEQTCDNRDNSFVSTHDLLDHCASQIFLRGYRISTSHSRRSFIFCVFNLLRQYIESEGKQSKYFEEIKMFPFCFDKFQISTFQLVQIYG